MDSTTIEILKEARRLIAEKGWTQGTFYRDSMGNSCYRASDESVCCSFCLVGAILFAGRGHRGRQVEVVWDLLERSLPKRVSVPEWNDDPRRTKEEVIALFDHVIESVTK